MDKKGFLERQIYGVRFLDDNTNERFRIVGFFDAVVKVSNCAANVKSITTCA